MLSSQQLVKGRCEQGCVEFDRVSVKMFSLTGRHAKASTINIAHMHIPHLPMEIESADSAVGSCRMDFDPYVMMIVEV